MRRFVRFAGGAVAAAAVLLIAPVPASAGGPTSVLLVSPGRQVATALYNSDAAYSRLEQVLGQGQTSDPAAPDLQAGPGTSAINITWLAHDVSVWRVDRVVVDAAGGPWVMTSINRDGRSELEFPGIAHRPNDAKVLIDLLTGLKLLGEPTSPDQGVKAPLPAALSPPAVSQPVANVSAEREVADLNWLWLLVGGAAGAVLVIGLRPLARRLRRN